MDDLRLLRAIGEVGSLSGAARHLAIDHSSAFRRLGSIEKRFGAQLFERARQGYTPTLAGETALGAAAHVLDDLSDLERRLSGEDLRPAGSVRITTTDTLVELTAPIFAALRGAHSEITVELVIANTFLTLTKRDADIALRPVARAPDRLVGRRLAALATAPYAAPKYLAQQPRTSLTDHAWLGFDDSLRRLRSAQWLEAHITPENIVYRADSLMALRAAAESGMGVACLPCYLGDLDPKLRRVQVPLPEMEVSLWLLTHPDLRRVSRIRTVLDFLTQQLTAQRALLEGCKPQT